MTLFITGFVQVFFVAVNTFFLAREMYWGVMVASFMISLVWSFNVKRVAFGSFWDRVVYSLGAMCGSLFGLFVASLTDYI
jgi:hypothetical protein